MNERIEVNVYGRVQLVMYRDFAQRKAHGLKITGTVKNIADGSVRVVAEGTSPQLAAYVKKLSKGPLLARVDSLDVAWLPATNEYKKFSIIYE